MFSCNCLNITGELINGQKKEDDSKSKINHVQSCTTNSLYYELLDFFKLALGFTCDEMKVTVQHPIFVSKVKMNKWTVQKCLNCDSNVYATFEDNRNEFLVNEDMLRDKNSIAEMIKNENYSLPFKMILKQIDLLPNTIKATINDDVHVKNLFTKLQDFISHDASETEAEIRKLQSRMNQRRQQAEKEFQLIVTLKNSIESNSSDKNFSNLDSTNDHIQSLYSTPPVTPESAQLMTIDQLPHHPIIKHVDHNHREGISKHSNAIAIQQKVTRTIDFEDDIFELDGMQKSDPIDENDRYHKYSDTDGSDVEEMITEKRPYARGRSGSLAIARSAPITMPFLHHPNPHLEEKNNINNINNDHDIASSIKLLAKSIHADSIFGELPNSRPVFKYNTDF